MRIPLTRRISARAYATADRLEGWLDKRLMDRWSHSFGDTPRASIDTYKDLALKASAGSSPEIDALETRLGFSLDKEWLHSLALHTQVVVKKSDLFYMHGRILYALLRQYIDNDHHGFINILETGTARGFSAICMAKAAFDSGKDHVILTIDVLPHDVKMLWNTIDDFDGPRTRASLLAPWNSLTERIIFVQGDSARLIGRVHFQRIHFAFLDAQHTYRSVLTEFKAIEKKQTLGDLIVFDDVTPEQYPGVVRAVNEIEADGRYEIERLSLPNQRGYAWGRRIAL